jgi:hypothetical protein
MATARLLGSAAEGRAAILTEGNTLHSKGDIIMAKKPKDKFSFPFGALAPKRRGKKGKGKSGKRKPKGGGS